MLLKGAYCVGEHFVDPQCTFYEGFLVFEGAELEQCLHGVWFV